MSAPVASDAHSSFSASRSRLGGRFRRVEPQRRARAFVLGLLAELPRKNCWTIAEHAGDPSPEGTQHLLVCANGMQTACTKICGRG
jgi:hypothetical protein